MRNAGGFVLLFSRKVLDLDHCGGGPGPDSFDMLPALAALVEKGVAPASVTASRVVDGQTERTRPLCPHPQVARYSGKGSVDDAASFRCESKP